MGGYPPHHLPSPNPVRMVVLLCPMAIWNIAPVLTVVFGELGSNMEATGVIRQET